MSGFAVALADGGCTVAVPLGETVIGRGPLLGITDKRVSRKHAILKVHINPCFYQPSENSQLLPLDIDKWHQLNPGDTFSLLVDKYVFKVLFSPSDVESLPRMDTLQKSSLFCEMENENWSNRNLNAEEISNQAPSTPQSIKMSCRQTSQPQTPSSSKSKLLKARLQLESASETSPKLPADITENEEPRPAQRKRVLPSWMLQGDLTAQSSSASIPERGYSEDIKNAPGKKRRATESENVSHSTQAIQKISTTCAARKMKESDNKMVPHTAESSVGQCDFQLQNQELEPNPVGQDCQPTEMDTMDKREDNLAHVGTKIEQSCLDKPLQSPVQQTQELIPYQTTETEISNLTESQNIPQSSNATKSNRTPCQYGRNCYRKNPIHFQEFSHPGDSDYHDMKTVTQTDNDNRPECPYGTACYRKNPQHKLEYKHTLPPEPERRQKRLKAMKKGRSVLDADSDNDGEPNEYDLNDSFLDDDEEEEEYDPTDEDSDWEPDSQDKNNEDVDRLLKEAQRFVKSKK
ncbi:aprataxin and PNK-like factor isoform X2 [Tiliqua scincoides]|uniref:aprataxin and PNK-like factor isoform X2 n=1 Tax=Tiliqua scincoides TaxID=71010 RepID=UPI0034632B02